ncbi:MAG: hypothetical protein L6V95_04600 [Candidatus Melainabacteria bacterium]|nr:MAG: hypothetical protein L6V95_04600 [Candidatus Melainabacteria bacterium]
MELCTTIFFNGINASDMKTRIANKQARVKQIIEIKESNKKDEEKENELRKIEGFQNLSRDQIHVLLGIKKQEYKSTPREEIVNALKRMLNYKK